MKFIMTLIELKGLDVETYVDTDGITKTLEYEAEYDSFGGAVESWTVSETDEIAWPWLHDFSNWLFRINRCDNPTQSWDDLPF